MPRSSSVYRTNGSTSLRTSDPIAALSELRCVSVRLERFMPAADFEKHRKSGSGQACARRHFGR